MLHPVNFMILESVLNTRDYGNMVITSSKALMASLMASLSLAMASSV